MARTWKSNEWTWDIVQTTSLECDNANDIFSYKNATETNGNKVMTTPAGLITSDEALLAGGFGGTENSNYYLYTGQTYWTMSPFNCYSNYARVFFVASTGNIAGISVKYSYGLRPIINLKANTIFSGSGTYSDPFIPTSLS